MFDTLLDLNPQPIFKLLSQQTVSVKVVKVTPIDFPFLQPFDN